MPADSSQDRSSPIESLFAGYLAQLAAGARLDFEDMCSAHPEQAEALRALHKQYEDVEKLVRAAGERSRTAPSLADRLKQTYGEGVDPEISLDAEPVASPSSTATAALVERLKEHGFANSRYRLEGEFARGGMGAILKIWDQDLRRHLAMKVILGRDEAVARSGTPPVDSKHLARFLEEAQVTGQLDHPGIVPVHELGLDAGGRVYFTMKLVKGRDLKRVFDLVFEEKEGWNETRALSVVLKVCEAMAYAHTKRVIHRDLKPANVMVGNFGEVYVMDWGLARVLGRGDSHDIRIQPQFTTSLESVQTDRRDEREDQSDSPIVTMDGDVVGTPAYMSPEQARGEVEKLNPRSDVYAIGAMLYHLLARQVPYSHGRRVSNHTLLALVLQGPPAALSSLREDLPAELVAICEKAMARDASQRYADTLGLAEDLRAYLERRVVRAYETGAWAEARKWVQRNKPLAAALAGAIMLLVVGLTTSLVFKRRADENAGEAREQARIATERAMEVLSLSVIPKLKELIERADGLWPALPEKLAGYDRWLADASVLIEGRAADPSRGIAAHPGLQEHEAKLAEILQRAKPWTAEPTEADRRASPSFAEWERSRAKLTWLSRMLGEEPWPSEPEVEAQLSKESLPATANGLNSTAWPLVDPDPAKAVYGNEVKALVLARRAVAAAQESERAGIRDTLAWALYRCGLLDEALTEEQRAVDESKDKQREELSASLKHLETSVASWRDAASRAEHADEKTRLSARVAALERVVDLSWEFDEDRFWYVQLSQLVSDLNAFHDPRTGLYSAGFSEGHGWGVVKRAEFARTIGDRSISGSEAKRRWDEAIAAIAKSEKYRGLVLTPQLGMLPIGMDAESGLWEFAHLASGEPAERGAHGKLILKEETGLVFVLIPAGTFWMGAQKIDPKGRNYDPQAYPNEAPVHELELSAYFLSKFEMTQGQWERFVGRNPSMYGPQFLQGVPASNRHEDLLHPVEQVSWVEGTQLLWRHGLALPTEAQWEYAARAGTSTPWWTGDTKESLSAAANVGDSLGRELFDIPGAWEEWLNDGHPAHSPVGSYRANGFGLHDTVGNIWEWCREAKADYGLAFRPKDGLRLDAGEKPPVVRGGGFMSPAADTRVSKRGSTDRDLRDSIFGFRPVRELTL